MTEPKILTEGKSSSSLIGEGKGAAPLLIVVVKGDRLSADAIRRVAEEIFPQAEVRTCHNAVDALEILHQRSAWLGLFGLTLPDMDGLDLLTLVAEERLVSRLLVVSGRRDERSRQILRQARINGFFDCSTEPTAALGAAIRRMEEGRTYFSPTEGETLAGGRSRQVTLEQLLSLTEQQMFAVIGDGSDDQQAADCFGLSAKTVHSHRQRIMRKLGVRTRTELMKEAIRRGVVRITSDKVFRPGFDRMLAERQSRSPTDTPQGGG